MGEDTNLKIAGVSLPNDIRVRKVNVKNGPVFVHEKGSSPYDNLQQIALAVSCHRPVLLCGPVGSGKTSTVEYLAFRTGHHTPISNDKNSEKDKDRLFIKVQLGEQTDSRMLLGGYQCTEIPGQFVWKPGILTQAVLNGYWLLLEDIDCTSSDVITVIENLVKTQSLCIPGYCESIVPHSHFQLFATQRTQGYELSSGVQNTVLKQWSTILMKPLTRTEIKDVICQKYPKLAAVASRLVSVLDVEFYENVPASGRLPSVRDILKWCSRCDVYFKAGSIESSLRIFHDAVDIFCGFMEKGVRMNLASQIGIKLGIVENKANFISNKYKPTVIVSDKELVAGRARLKKSIGNVTLLNKCKSHVFSLNRQSSCLIEKISCCLENSEPVLLVGETGCGKTTVLQYVADTLGKNLVVINMNQQSDTADLLGGFKPVSFKWIMKPFCDQFEILFRDLFKADKNVECLNKFSRLIKKENWEVLLKFMIHVQKTAMVEIENRLKNLKGDEGIELKSPSSDIEKWQKRRNNWKDLGKLIDKYSKQRLIAEKSLVFSFVEGSLITAIRKGYWVLLDEINLANSETLDCLSGLLENSNESISLLEKGESQPVYRNSDFRLFAAMNPATDVGKKQLPIGLRNRFTEFYIDELDDHSDLHPLVETYLSELNQAHSKLRKIVTFYLNVKNRPKNDILNANGKKPNFSLRNLCRALLMTSRNPCGSFSRSMYECLSISFLTQLDHKSYELVKNLILDAVTEGNIKKILNQPIPKPSQGNYTELEGFWLPVGSLTPFVPNDYIITPTVKRHLRDLIKIVSLGSGIPVLLEGDTSVGKTSLINYLAKCTGNVCSRVNNHEHTDIQEYIGTYVADSNGKLVFKEGILCEAMRKGHWLILDELNLAPTEVLEALNRVLDDNRELFIPETQETIKAHDRFLLFATQNPTGMYGGRKELSRAFRNRFIELQFNQIPANELVTILEKRCQLPVSYCKKMVGVMTDLQLRRRGSDIFVGKAGFITLRDLFRWGERYRRAQTSDKYTDWEQLIADEGYLLLAGRVRLQEESRVVEEVIAKYFKKRPEPNNLFSLHEKTSPTSRDILKKLIQFSDYDAEFSHIVWTYSMRRLAVLVCKALQFSEPALIVGETGCGKTSVVQLLAKINKQPLFSVNCHMHSEGADFLGGLRPVRGDSRASGKLFEWCDGPLVNAMVTGSFFLADEISLADDSVLERLNSLLEPERTILLAEKGGELLGNENEEYVIVADPKFQFIGTMNPGGDYGKKELSPALRNRFTEIWADATHNKYESFHEIIMHNLNISSELREKVPGIMTDFLKWFQQSEIGKRITLSNRDVMTWVNFMKSVELDWFESSVHGIFVTFLDGLGLGTHISYDGGDSLKKFKEDCLNFYIEKCSEVLNKSKEELHLVLRKEPVLAVEENQMGIPPFFVEKGKCDADNCNYVYVAPTTFSNAQKIFRALTLKKAILLEGSPGVGKTSIVSALAKVTGHKLTRINLSDQTDISDLFGADLPEEGGKAGSFVWKDGPFLRALKEGHWILLDELNLASQAVLEGLNAVLDHRGSVYIPELNKVFQLSDKTKLFGCQNPLKEGGNRRGLPSSFLNRFTKVYAESLTPTDYTIIIKENFPWLLNIEIKNESLVQLMVNFTCEVSNEISKGTIGLFGAPWEFNLRDIVRWAEGVTKDLNLDKKESNHIAKLNTESKKDLMRAIFKYMDLLYLCRFRSQSDRKWINELFFRWFGDEDFSNEKVEIYKTDDFLVIGGNVTNVNNLLFYGDVDEFEMFVNPNNTGKQLDSSEEKEILKLCLSYHGKRKFHALRILEKQYPVLSSLCHCISMNWLPILVGDSGSGKTSCVRVLAALKGEKLRVMSCNSAMDTTEILGGFEQADFNRHIDEISESSKVIVLSAARRCLKEGSKKKTLNLLKKWLEYHSLSRNKGDLSGATIGDHHRSKIDKLIEVLKMKELTGDKCLNRLRTEAIFQLEELRRKISAENYASFGGKFEWVDSVLVKALKEGSWLLMEDVNLCSNAVLDRLNGLLEPNGRLTIGERGAGPDGQVISLIPHPNFRLFFTMNPANGPISRAMRNRGVEIFMSLDKGLKNWQKVDLISLLNDTGIEDVHVQKALLDIERDAENPDISNLVLNGFWCCQYLKQGFSKDEALAKSTAQTYKFSTDTSKEPLLEKMCAKLKETERRTLNVSLMRPDLNVYIVDVKLARLKQCCSLLHQILTGSAVSEGALTSASEIAEHVFGFDISLKENVPLLKLAKLNLFHVFASSSTDVLVDLKSFLSPYLSVLPSNSEFKKVLVEETNLLVKIIPEVDAEHSALPWDLRWFDSLYRLYGGDFGQSKVNNRFILMKFALAGFDQMAGTKNIKTGLTIEEYSKHVEKGRLEDSLPDYPAAGNFFRFLTAFDTFTADVLNGSGVDLTDEEVRWFLDVMKWRFRLENQGQLVLHSGKRRKELVEDTLTQLRLHVSWLYKAFVNTKENGIGQISNLQNEYRKFFGQTERLLFSKDDSDSLIKICNEFRKCLGCPIPSDLGEPNTVEENRMDVDAGKEIQFDSVIIRSILNDFVEHYNSRLTTALVNFGENTESVTALTATFRSLLALLEKDVRHVGSLKNSLETFFRSANLKDKSKYVSELLYLSLSILNENYEFADETEPEVYVKQILPHHRAVWTWRILNKVFDRETLWNLSNHEKSRVELSDLTSTVFPNAVRKFHVFDFLKNECERLKYEMNRVANAVKKSLNTTLSPVEAIAWNVENGRSVPERKFFEKIYEATTVLSSLNVEDESKARLDVGCIWSILGILEFQFLREGKIDPIRKKLFKAEYAEMETGETLYELLALKLHSAITGINLNHVYVESLKEGLKKSQAKIVEYKHLAKIMRDPVSFRAITLEMDNFVTVSEEILSFCRNVAERRFEKNSASHMCRKGRYFLIKTRTTCREIEKLVLYFEDLTKPILAALSQIEHGLNLTLSELIRLPFSNGAEVERYVASLGRFPVSRSVDFLSELGQLDRKSWPPKALDKLRENQTLLLFSSYLIGFNEWCYFRREEKLVRIIEMFSLVVEHWKIEEEKLKQKEIEKESLYLKRGSEQCKTQTEEEELLSETLKLFPKFDEDFTDEERPMDVTGSKFMSLNENHLLQVSRLHMNIMKHAGIGLWDSSQSSPPLIPDHVTPLCMRLSLLFEILPQVSFLLTRESDEKLLPGLLVLMEAKKSGLLSSEVKLVADSYTNYDFYHDPNPGEAKKCLEILDDLRASINYFLKEWPEHPGLLEMKKIIAKILSFSIESPIARFLTGMELLLKSGQDWERVAIEKVSILDHLQKMTGLIIEWRKMELKGWRICLEAAHERMKKKASKWWFHFWCFVEEYLTKSKSEEAAFFNDLIKTLANFLELSPAGEYDVRLDIILSFHHHLLHLPATKKRDNLCIALWNLHSFYQQFRFEVLKKIKADSGPIFTKLNQFVKIAKWHDITYWSVKQAIDKSHRTLVKCIKEYEVLLKKKVDLISFDLTSDSKEKRKPSPDKSKKSEKTDEGSWHPKRISLHAEKIFQLPNMRRKLKKVDKLIKSVIQGDGYAGLISGLDDLTGQICENVEYFSKLDVNQRLPPEKRKCQAKTIVQQRRRALTDLFKTLSLIGASYRAGLSQTQFGVVDICNAPPMRHEDDGSLSSEGEIYYLKCVSRRLQLMNSLLSPSKEIGPQVIERLRGFAGHLMEINGKQRVTLNESATTVTYLTAFQKSLRSLTETDITKFYLVNQKRFSESVSALLNVLQTASCRLDEFTCVLNSWPETEGLEKKNLSFLGCGETPEIFTASKSDESYATAHQMFDEHFTKLKSLRKKVEERFNANTPYKCRLRNGINRIFKDDFRFFTANDVDFFNRCILECQSLRQDLGAFVSIFKNESIECRLTEEMNDLLRSFDSCLKYTLVETIKSDEKMNFENILIRLVEKLIKNILLAVQSIVKKLRETKTDVPEGDAEITETLKNHLSERLVESLANDITQLNMKRINQNLSGIFKQLSAFSSSDVTTSTTNIYRILYTANAFVEPFFFFCEYFVNRQSSSYRTSNKLTSIVLKVFTMVAQKGYCAPPDYEEESGDGNEAANDKEGGGFTGNDGQGQKDVSDKIESEDQLEDARPSGAEKEDEGNQDCQEEKNGIEMSENFDGKAQDVDKEENDDDDSDSEMGSDEELDMEMGETEKGAEQLDSQMWSDSSDDEETNKNDKGGGEEIDKNEYAAKGEDENDLGEGDSEKENRKKQKKKDLNDMEDAEDNGDQIDPYHGHHEPEPEPEPMDLPEDMNLDDGEAKDDENIQEENQFDIDSMKKQQIPMETDCDDEEKPEKSDAEEDKKSEDENEDESEDMDVDQKESSDVEDEPEQQEESGDEVDENGGSGGGGTNEKEDENERDEENAINQDETPVPDDKSFDGAAQSAPDQSTSRDQVVGNTETEPKDFQPQETFQESEMEPKGVGQAEAQGNKLGHDADASKKDKLKPGQPQTKKERKRERPGKSSDDRCLAEEESTVNKKLKTIDEPNKLQKENSEETNTPDESDIYQHMTEKIESATQVLDAATKDQSQSQPMPRADDEQENEPENEEEDDVEMDMHEDLDVEMNEGPEWKPSKLEESKNGRKNTENEKGEGTSEDVKHETEGDVIETMTVERGPETTLHFKSSALSDGEACFLQPHEIESLRQEIQKQLLLHNGEGLISGESATTWQLLMSVVDGLARDLSEQLRIILEPTRATRLKGDYRTGRRINMRKVISYVASDFRKDNIWLRRTKPWKRDHEIVVALDDSESMFLNKSGELAFESLALVFRALELVEAGRLGVLSFGEKTKIVHGLEEPFSVHAGARIIQDFSFKQKKTLLCEMLNLTVTMMEKNKKGENVAQLLLIISDGRGIFSEGVENVRKTVRRATDSGIFVVFIIMDNPMLKNSIMDIRMPEFKDGKFVEMKSYMEQFPFPFYLVVRDINTLPNTLSDALRQWFQLIHCTSSN